MRVIAEVGSNWKTFEDCIESIHEAKACGADTVKFQSYTHRDLFGVPGKTECLPNIRALAIESAISGIEFMCTGFSADEYYKIDQWVTRHKIASSEITDHNILSTVNGFRKPVLLSTGGATANEIDTAVRVLRDCAVTLLYCVVAYPARIVDFRHLEQMRETYGSSCSYGYSDHSTDVLCIPSMAKRHGSSILEKHVNFTSHDDTPDAPHSLSKEEFATMIRGLRGDVPTTETFKPNPWKRKMITLPDGTRGFFRPLPDAG